MRRASIIVVALAIAMTLVSTPGRAQLPPVFETPQPSATPTPEPVPTLTPPPTPTPAPVPTVPGEDTPAPTDTARPIPTPTPAPAETLPPGLDEQIEIPVLPRTRPRNTVKLVSLLDPLVEEGLPHEQVYVEGMARFPVGGLASYSDDWLFPRYNPYFHLHKGIDIFADFGTPVRAPDAGVVTRMTQGATGGIGVWTRGLDGTDYYFAHMLEYAHGLAVGQRIEIGTVLGYVGDSGNARGGTPHLHMEIHRGEAIPPKPWVDRWLDEAEELAPTWVQARTAELRSKRELIQTDRPVGAPQEAGLEASMVLTLLDPVAGSVGLLPQLEIEAPKRPAVSKRLLDELVLRRLDGFMLVPGSQLGD